jgi:ApaG protein
MSYESETDGFRVRVWPNFSLAQSDPNEGRFVFMYRIEVENETRAPAQLMYRHWHIHDSSGDDSEVDGEGVVGEQPLILPGDRHAYQSICILSTPAGFMEGYYTFAWQDGQEFQVSVPRFDLAAPWTGIDEDAPVN